METKRTQFSLGQVLSTAGVIDTLHPEDVLYALSRHIKCDWGDCCPDVWRENAFALDKNLPLFSVYHDRRGTKFWVITEADRSATIVLLPSEY